MRIVDADKIVESIKAQGNIVRSLGIEELTSMTNTIEEGFIQEINNAPTLDMKVERHGYWKKYPLARELSVCSSCKLSTKLREYDDEGELTVRYRYAYCPHCGAKMDEWEGGTE